MSKNYSGFNMAVILLWKIPKNMKQFFGYISEKKKFHIPFNQLNQI